MRRDQRGETNLSTMVWMAVAIAFFYACWNVVPVHMAHYTLADKCNELARQPRYSYKDEKIVEEIWKVVVEEKLTDYIDKGAIQVTTRDTSRQIQIKYQAELQVLPGYKRVFDFEVKADQPLI